MREERYSPRQRENEESVQAVLQAYKDVDKKMLIKNTHFFLQEKNTFE